MGIQWRSLSTFERVFVQRERHYRQMLNKSRCFGFRRTPIQSRVESNRKDPLDLCTAWNHNKICLEGR